MNWSDLFAAFALYLVLEGVMPFLRPQSVKRLMQALSGLHDQQLRLFGLISMSAGLVLLYWSAPGRELWNYVQGSRVELRKMVWPTRQETWRTTLVVFVFVLALGVFFFIVDWVLAKGMRYVTGQGA